LVESLRDAGIGTGSHVLIARAQEAREVLPESLRKMGADVHVVDSYRLLPAVPEPEALERLREGSVDLVTFASGATARHFLELVAASGLDPQAVMSSLVVASVGPVTTEGIERLGHAVDIEAPKATMESLVSSIVEYCARDRTQ
jgi:uroporphyrinogen III methyltransferase/synthase